MKYANLKYMAACPVCSHSENRLLYKVSSQEAANHFLITQGVDPNMGDTVTKKINDLWNKDTAAVVLCNNCGFGFADPFVAGDQEFYNLLPHASAEGPENWKWEFDKAYSKIDEISANHPDLTLLEIGASTGDFVKRIAGIIPKQNIFCLEHSEIGVDSIKKANIEAHSWDFRDLKNQKEFSKRFDVVCLFEVLEHLDHIDDTFRTIDIVTKPGGHLFIGVPNEKKIMFNELNDGLLDMPPNHICRYNKKSFEILSEKYGWTVKEISIEPYTVLEVMKTVMYYRSLKSLQFPALKESVLHRVREYFKIKYMALQAILRHRKLGETRWVHLRKSAS